VSKNPQPPVLMPPEPCPPHLFVTQEVTTPDGTVRTVRMCIKCGKIE